MTITALRWVNPNAPKDISREEITQKEINNAETEINQLNLNNQTKQPNEEENINEDKSEPDDDEIIKMYGLDTYEEETVDLESRVFKGHSNVFQGDDPNMIGELSDSSGESEEDEFEENDMIFLACKREEEFNSLEIHVHETEENNTFLHHEIFVPTPLLCAEWLSCHPGDTEGTYSMAALGSMDPTIELWNINHLDVSDPAAVLEAHQDAVTSLDWHPQRRTELVSGSADQSIRLWDLTTQRTAAAVLNCGGEVVAMGWQPDDASVLAAGMIGGRVAVADPRTASKAWRTQMEGDAESLCWATSTHLLVGTGRGALVGYDIRADPHQPLFQVSEAHQGACQDIVAAAATDPYPGLIVTGGEDAQLQFWDIRSSLTSSPSGMSPVVSRKLNIQNIFTLSLQNHMLAVGGLKGPPIIQNIRKMKALHKQFS